MPPRGVKKGTKRARQYEEVKKSVKKQGKPEPVAEEIAARTVNKEKARQGESRTASRTSKKDISSGRRGGKRSGTGGGGRTREQLYNDAKKQNIEGRSKMNKEQLARAVGRLAGRPALLDGLRRVHATDSLQGKSRSERAATVAGAFAVPVNRRDQVAGRRILLIDDVLTSGATANGCARTLLSAGAAQVDVLVAARVPEPISD